MTAIPSGSGYLASDPSVLRYGDGLVMYSTDVVETGTAQEATVIALARSRDGIVWDSHGTVARGRPGGRGHALEGAAAWAEEDGTLHLFASAYARHGQPRDGFPADLLRLQGDRPGALRHAGRRPVLKRSPGGFDHHAVYSPDIVRHDDAWVMVYCGHAYIDGERAGVRILGATSKDLRSWDKHDAVVLEADPDVGWMAAYVGEPALLHGPDDRWYLFFTAFPSWDDAAPAIGLAVGDSPFGPWQVAPEPILRPEQDWNRAWVGAPDVLLEDGRLRIWYTGVDERGVTSIGHASAPWPLYRP